jgi:hypothetical protein
LAQLAQTVSTDYGGDELKEAPSTIAELLQKQKRSIVKYVRMAI